jgi:hypothetical protein
MATEGTYKFYKDDRERVKGRSMLPTETLRYIEALEQIALASVEVYKHTPHANKPTELTRYALNELYDKLTAVNFMDETL